MSIDDVFREASEMTGWDEARLRKMATQVFASMLQNAMSEPDKIVWTYCRMSRERGLELEVDSPPRCRHGKEAA